MMVWEDEVLLGELREVVVSVSCSVVQCDFIWISFVHKDLRSRKSIRNQDTLEVEGGRY
jgi:hypothetical protein